MAGGNDWAAIVVCGSASRQRVNGVYSIETCTAAVQSLHPLQRNVIVLSDGTLDGYQWMLRWCVEWMTCCGERGGKQSGKSAVLATVHVGNKFVRSFQRHLN